LLILCTLTCHPGNSSTSGIRTVVMVRSMYFHGHHTLEIPGITLVFRPDILISTILSSNGSDLTFQVSPSSWLQLTVLSGAICSRRGPHGTLNAKAEEYANFPYLASRALCDFLVIWPDDRRK